ncbi:hypothetical protein KWH29_07670 [Xanthomonas campestris pv. paulliniae]|nr:hypothetical protein [Xanthomonas campestris pv. paulliniae]
MCCRRRRCTGVRACRAIAPATVTIHVPTQPQAWAHPVHAWRWQLANCNAVMHCSTASTSARRCKRKLSRQRRRGASER